jgi:K(+)-stimulated pyrophosphate-energized sodium pump
MLMFKFSFTIKKIILILYLLLVSQSFLFANETNLIIPKLNSINFLKNKINGETLLIFGLFVCIFGFLFGIYHFYCIKKLPVHKSMKDISELIYETCKTYLISQGKFILLLESFVIIVISIYFGFFEHLTTTKVLTISICSIVGILGSYFVSWFGIKINNFANSRTAFASLTGNSFFVHEIPLKAGISIGMLVISIELFMMLNILIFIPQTLSGQCLIGFAIGESLSASVLRIAGGIFTKIADIGSDLMKIIFNIGEDDARNPGVIADCAGDNAGDSIGPTADGFETYGVTGVALITFIILAVNNATLQIKLLVWIFSMRLIMLFSSTLSYVINHIIIKVKYKFFKKINFENSLTSLIWITSFTSIIFIFIITKIIIDDLGYDSKIWIKLSLIVSCGTIAGAIIPEIVKIFTSVKSNFVQNIITSSKHGGASLNILSGITAGNFSSYCMGIIIILLMCFAYFISLTGLEKIMISPSTFSFGLVAFGFLTMGPVTIAVDSYGPVADNAQSVYELSLIENIENINKEIENEFHFIPNFKKAKLILGLNDSAGNTFKATSKPVLIGTAIVGSTTMIFAIIVMLTNRLTTGINNISLLYPPFLFGLISGGAIIYWFSGASNHAVSSGAYKAIEFIKNNINLKETFKKASIENSKKVVEICTKYAQKGMINLFMVIFFTTLSFSFIEPYFFVGYLISIAMFGLFQSIFMVNAGGAWDNAKKYVEINLNEKGTDLHKSVIIGDTVGDPFKDTSSVSMNPIIKFTTLFGVLSLELSMFILKKNQLINIIFGIIFFLISIIFVIRSFTSMKIKQ